MSRFYKTGIINDEFGAIKLYDIGRIKRDFWRSNCCQDTIKITRYPVFSLELKDPVVIF